MVHLNVGLNGYSFHLLCSNNLSKWIKFGYGGNMCMSLYIASYLSALYLSIFVTYTVYILYTYYIHKHTYRYNIYIHLLNIYINVYIYMYMYIYIINSTTIHLRFSSILTNLDSKNHLKNTVKALE